MEHVKRWSSLLTLVSLLLMCLGGCHAALMDVVSDCCQRGMSYATLGRGCQDMETIPDVAPEDQEACMVIMKTCCSDRLKPILCEKAVHHRMHTGSCDTLSNDACFTDGRECCDCCDLGLKAYHEGISCSSVMTTGTRCDSAFEQCCESAASNVDRNECNDFTRLCSQKCINLIGNYVCECNEGNILLEDNITCAAADGRPLPPPRYLSCDRAPCQHECRQVGREYECICRTGFELMPDGYSCSDIDECANREQPACNYAERCVNNIGSFICQNDVVCREGLRYDSERQYCVDVDECAERIDTCNEDSRCNNRYGSYDCVPARCPAGYYFDRNADSCKDVDECSRGTHECPSGFRCDNLEGSFTCIRIIPCGTGYTINGVTQECVDVDECSQGNHNCQPNERCINIRGSYRCESCPLGFRTDYNNRCTQDIDECQEGTYRCPDGTRCQNNLGSYDCISICMQGFEYNRVLRACMDIDECRRGLANCAIYELCQNLNGSFSCGCRRGFRKNNFRECVDIDECREGLSECLPNQRCYNLQGQYQCRNMCRTGFRFNSITNYCEDIDECAEGLHRCQDNQRCINQEGGYVCQCPAGHQANRERGTCDDINECELGLCRGTCENLPGSYVCTCPAGYALMENKITCKDVDECSTGTDQCVGDEICFNTRGSHKCKIITCPQYYVLRASNDIQCVKQCPLDAPDCPPKNINNTITHTFVALPSITFVRQPIRLLTIGLPHRSTRGVNTETYFNIRNGNEDNYFSITRVLIRGSPTGYLSLQRPISGPYETVLDLEIVTGVWNPASSYLKIHIDVGEHTY